MAAEIETGNDQLVGLRGSDVVVTMPLPVMTKAEALRHAAWLVVVADDHDRFPAVLAAVRST